MELFVIQIPLPQPPSDDEVMWPEDVATGREILAEIDPEQDRSFIAFGLRDLKCDFHDCDLDAEVAVVAAHRNVRETNVHSFCRHHSECVRVAIDTRRPGELDAAEIDRLYAELISGKEP